MNVDLDTPEGEAWAGATLSACSFGCRNGRLIAHKNSTRVASLMILEQVFGGHVGGAVVDDTRNHLGSRPRRKWHCGDHDLLVHMLGRCWDWLMPETQERVVSLVGPELFSTVNTEGKDKSE